MSLIITESADEKIVINDNCIHIFIEDLLLFKYKNIIDYLDNYLIRDQIDCDEVFNSFELSMEVREDIYDHILGKIDYEILKQKLENCGLSICDILRICIQTREYFRIYNRIKDSVKNIDRIVINCNEDNILRALIVAREIEDKTVILNCGNMKMYFFFDIIRDIDINYYFDTNMAIYFNGHSKAIDFYKFFLALKCLASKAIEHEESRREIEKKVHIEVKDGIPQSQEEIFLSQDIFKSLLEKKGKENNKTGRRTRRIKFILN